VEASATFRFTGESMTGRAFALCALLLAAAAPAAAQRVSNGGLAALGVASADSRYLEPSWTIVFGWDRRWPVARDFRLGLRGAAEYSRLEPDVAAYLDSLGLPGAVAVEGGVTSVVATGFDVLGGYQAGRFGGHLFAGIRYVRDRREELNITTSDDIISVRGDSDSGLGGTWGAGVTWDFGPAGLLVEYFRTGGFAEEMIKVEGVRAGVFWAW
jgi:hypothetical protein